LVVFEVLEKCGCFSAITDQYQRVLGLSFVQIVNHGFEFLVVLYFEADVVTVLTVGDIDLWQLESLVTVDVSHQGFVKS
jgi:hypothetical protein